MLPLLDTSLIDWSRAQFALTAMYHWLFVPLTLGLGILVSIMETVYYIKRDEFWRQLTRFWMKLFAVNFAIGVATGLILEFEFGTNWSNYSWLVGDIFGAPLAIEGIVAFFMESTFIAVMYFGWNKVGRGFHLSSTWLTAIGATISAWWILCANSWMQYPVGMEFNPETVRHEMVSFVDVAFSPVAVTKFIHTVTSGWLTGAVFVAGVSCWFLLRKRQERFARASLRVASAFGLFSCLVVMLSGDNSGVMAEKTQPMKLAAMEGLYDGSNHAPLTVAGPVEIPNMLTVLATHTTDSFVPGINDLLNGGYTLPDGTKALSAEEKMQRGRDAMEAFKTFRQATKDGDTLTAAAARETLTANMPYFGYGSITSRDALVPPVGLLFWSFRVMVGLGMLFLLIFIALIVLDRKQWLHRFPVVMHAALWSIPLVYVCGQAGWICAEVGRQPWAIQDLLPVGTAVSSLSTGAVQLTFFLFLAIFTVLLIAEVKIMCNVIKKGPEM